jgi:epoxyqueuosine reductase QueG
MAYMARTAERRGDVRAVVPGARSVIVTGTVYNTVPPYASQDVPANRTSTPGRSRSASTRDMRVLDGSGRTPA